MIDASSAPSPTPTVPDSSTATTRPGILVVEDDRAVQALLHAVLTHRGFQVWTAGSGLAAVELSRSVKGRLDVLLLDVCMPGLDGPATLAELRRSGVDVPACFMSGHTALYSVDELLGLGAVRFFEKPFQIEVLAGEVWRLARPDHDRPA
jgi:two-component system OmpR family response regulator